MRERDMDKNNIGEIAQAIADLNVWKRTAMYNWAIVSKQFFEPFIVVGDPIPSGPVKARIRFFHGYKAHHEFLVFNHEPHLSYALDLTDLDHFAVLGLNDGTAKVMDYRPGYIPVVPEGEFAQALAPLLYECYGMLMRIDENPELPAAYSGQNALFSRVEGLDGKWRDAPLPLPREKSVTWTERMSLDPAKNSRAKRFDLARDETWDVDFVQVPLFSTGEERARAMYLFAGIDAKTGERRVWRRMAVDPETPRTGTLEALKCLWESLAGTLLDAIVERGMVPGAVRVRSNRMMRLLRPLGEHLPFKLVLHSDMTQLDSTIGKAVAEQTI